MHQTNLISYAQILVHFMLKIMLIIFQNQEEVLAIFYLDVYADNTYQSGKNWRNNQNKNSIGPYHIEGPKEGLYQHWWTVALNL